MKLNDIYLPRCIPNRSLHHSIQADQLVLWSLDSRASPVSLGYQVDQVGPGYLSVLHLANLKIKESVLVKKNNKNSQNPSVCLTFSKTILSRWCWVWRNKGKTTQLTMAACVQPVTVPSPLQWLLNPVSSISWKNMIWRQQVFVCHLWIRKVMVNVMRAGAGITQFFAHPEPEASVFCFHRRNCPTRTHFSSQQKYEINIWMGVSFARG